MMADHFIKAQKGNNDIVILNMPSFVVRQLETIVSASLNSDPVIRGVDEDVVLRLAGILKARIESGTVSLSTKDFDSLAQILTAVAAEDLGDIGIEDEEIANLETEVWEIKNNLSGPKVA